MNAKFTESIILHSTYSVCSMESGTQQTSKVSACCNPGHQNECQLQLFTSQMFCLQLQL